MLRTPALQDPNLVASTVKPETVPSSVASKKHKATVDSSARFYQPLFVRNKYFTNFVVIPFCIIGILGFALYALIACIDLFPNAGGWIAGLYFFVVEGSSRAFDAIASTFDPEDKKKHQEFWRKRWVNILYHIFRLSFLVATIVTFTMRYVTVLLALNAALPLAFCISFGVVISVMMAISLVFYTDQLMDTMQGVENEEKEKRIAKFLYMVQSINYVFLTTVSFWLLLPSGIGFLALALLCGITLGSVTYISLQWNLDVKANQINRLLLEPKISTWKTKLYYIAATACNVMATGVLGVTLYVGFKVYLPMILGIGISATPFIGIAIVFSIGFAMLMFCIVQQVAERYRMQMEVEAYYKLKGECDQKAPVYETHFEEVKSEQKEHLADHPRVMSFLQIDKALKPLLKPETNEGSTYSLPYDEPEMSVSGIPSETVIEEDSDEDSMERKSTLPTESQFPNPIFTTSTGASNMFPVIISRYNNVNQSNDLSAKSPAIVIDAIQDDGSALKISPQNSPKPRPVMPLDVKTLEEFVAPLPRVFLPW